MNNISIIGLKDLRQNTEKYISAVRRGKSFTVVRRSKPVFRISRPDESGTWEPVADFSKLRKGGIALNDILTRL